MTYKLQGNQIQTNEFEPDLTILYEPKPYASRTKTLDLRSEPHMNELFLKFDDLEPNPR